MKGRQRTVEDGGDGGLMVLVSSSTSTSSSSLALSTRVLTAEHLANKPGSWPHLETNEVQIVFY